MLKKLFSFENKIIVSLLAILGFTVGCPNVEYGIPYCNLNIKGKVTSSSNGEKIENIEVSIYGDTLYTNSEGQFSKTLTLEGGINQYELKINASDIDSTENGYFEDTEQTVTVNLDNLENGDNDWYLGEKTVDVEIKLDEKEE